MESIKYNTRWIKSTNLFVTLVAVVRVGAFQEFAFYVLFQRVQQIALISYVDADDAERFFFGIPKRKEGNGKD